MKNLHILPTDKLSKLISSGKEFNLLDKFTIDKRCRHIYITSDEEIKEGDWFVLFSDKNNIRIEKCTSRLGDKTSIWFNHSNLEAHSKYCKKIILTTDQSLDGVQAIDDEFLEWFVKNPSCEEIEVVKQMLCDYCGQEHCDNLRCRGYEDSIWYEIIIPKEKPLTKLQIAKNIDAIDIGKEEPKQETLEEAVKRLYPYIDELHLKRAFKQGVKWQQETSISKEAYEDALNMQKCSNAGYESKIKELQSEIERMYSGEDMKNAFDSAREFNSLDGVVDVHIVLPMGGDMSDLQPLHFTFEEWFEQFKKK